MVRFLSDARNSLIVGAALILLGACAHLQDVPKQSSRLEASILETRVWIDIMPGAPHRGYALWNISLSNSTTTPLNIVQVDGAICDTLAGPSFRRFSCVMEVNGKTVSSLSIPPGETRTILVKSAAGYEPFDTKRYNFVLSRIAFTVADGKSEVFESAPTNVIVTQ